MKLLFLDIDGVLNSKRSEESYGKQRTVENLDPIAVCLIHRVVEETGCIICLSSDWRLSHDYMELGKELGLPILFKTPDYPEYPRSSEIKTVIDGIKPEKYAIVDDQEENGEFNNMNFVQPDMEDGLSYKNYLELVEFLK
jgi:hypothetical protein